MHSRTVRLAWLSMFGLLSVLATPVAGAKAKVGEQAPKFILRTVDGQKITAEELRGKVVLLNLWATWCVPCKAELPLLDAAERQYRDKGFAVFAVATEDSVSPAQLIKKIGPSLKLTLVRNLAGSSYQPLGGVPTNYVIDRQGVLRYAKGGAFSEQSLVALLTPLLNEPAPETTP